MNIFASLQDHFTVILILYNFNTIFTLLQDHPHTMVDGSLPPLSRILGHCQPHTNISRIQRCSSSFAQRPRCKRRDQYCKIVYLLDPKGIEVWKSFTWDDPVDKENPAKVFNKFHSSFQTPNMQQIYRKEAQNLKQWGDETGEQLDIRLINILLECGYQEDQMDTRKVDVMFNTIKQFKIRHYTRTFLETYI